MGKTQHYGLNKFGAEGRISDEGYKFTLRDRDLIDTLLYTLSTHDHKPTLQSETLAGPPPNVYLDLTLSTISGTLPSGKNYFYKFSYMDANGNETAASSAVSVSTPTALTPPQSQVLTVATIGGSLTPGTYKYAMAFYQTTGVTTAPNLSTALIPAGTNTNTVTIPLEELPDGAAGWRIYRKGPGDLEYWLLDTVASGPTQYVDDGSVSPDCTKKRPLSNSTNSTNRVIIDLPASELPLSKKVVAWRVYRSTSPGAFSANSLVAQVVETVTEGGGDLVTQYIDVGGSLSLGSPLLQTAVPEAPGQLDASSVFAADSGPLPSALAPLGVQAFNLLLPGTLAAKTYHQFSPPYNMVPKRIDAFYSGAAPTGLVAATNFLTLRVADDDSQNEVQSLYNDAFANNEIQTLFLGGITTGTFTLTFSGQTTTPLPGGSTTSAQIKAALEALSNITEVTVSGAGTSADRWVIEFLDPGNQNVAQMTANTGLLGGGFASLATVTQGNDGGTFILSDGVNNTTGIAYNAAAATIKTRLETDIASITTVNVTGTGTEADPWLIEFVNPGGQNVDPLIVTDTNLNGSSTIAQVTRGYGPTEIDLVIDLNQQAHTWVAPATTFASQEAEEAPATGTGNVVSDNMALNDVAYNLDAQNEYNEWTIGALDPGEYVFRLWVSNYDKTAEFRMELHDMNGPTALRTVNVDSSRSTYEPAYEIEYTVTGTENLRLRVTKTDSGVDRIRVDKYEYELHEPILHGLSNVVLSVLQTGTPTTNGDDLQVTLWY